MKTCRDWPATRGLPMWLLSVLLVYEPVNAWFSWHKAEATDCHNLGIFEVLFGLSCIVATTLSVKHCSGFRNFAALIAVVLAISAARMPYANPYGSNEAGEVDLRMDHRTARANAWTWEILPTTISRLLPASLIAALLASASDTWAGKAGLRMFQGDFRRHLVLPIALTLIAATFVFDLLLWSQSFVAGNWRLTGGSIRAWKVMVEVWAQFMASDFLRPVAVQRLLTICFEVPMVVGLSLLMHLGETREKRGSESATWLRVFSRLSLGINLANIFVLHYVSGYLHDINSEFSQVHLTLYTGFAWVAAAVLALCVHCLAAPYAVLVIRLARAVHERVLSRSAAV